MKADNISCHIINPSRILHTPRAEPSSVEVVATRPTIHFITSNWEPFFFFSPQITKPHIIMGWTAEQSKILSIIPHFTGAFSFIGSSSIIIMILRDRRKKLSKPYYRLLFAMCVFDIFASVALGLSTWPIPEGSPGVYDPKGTVGTCSAQAFFIQANIASPVYNFMWVFVSIILHYALI